MGERRQIARYVRDLKDLDPERYAPKSNPSPEKADSIP